MEEVVKKKAFELPPLTPDDRKRINGCDYYTFVKTIMKSAEDYKDYEVGSAVYIRNKTTNKRSGQEYDISKSADKYIIVENDNGFLFAKRINANGKPGVAITCLTIEYKSEKYTLEVDDDYVEAMLLDNQESYDPLANAKDLSRRKNKATRENQKKRLMFNTDAEAYAYLSTIKIGDTFFDADYSYGGGVTEYVVDHIIVRPAVAGTGTGWSRNYGDDEYIARGFKDYILIHLKAVSSTKKYTYDNEFQYKHISKESSWNKMLFKEKPLSPEDVT